MVGRALPCTSCLMAYVSAVVLVACLQDSDASDCQYVIHKKVGDTVELSSHVKNETLSIRYWKYGEKKITDGDLELSGNQFKDRMNLNKQNFDLTVKKLTLNDSGKFFFISSSNDSQRPTVCVNLRVHEPITKQPTLTFNYMNQTCKVALECKGTPSDASITWMVGNQTMNVSKIKYVLQLSNEDTKFTCIISNFVSNVSASKVLKCNNQTQKGKEHKDDSADWLNIPILVGAGAGAGCLIIVVVGAVLCVRCRETSNPAESESNDLTLYADISEVTNQDKSSNQMKPSSVYETIGDNVTLTMPKPETVYDRISFSRLGPK